MRLLMIADDFTGALDAGVQFAKKGFKTNVLVADGVCMSQYEDTEILVIDAETRHREAKEAGAIVQQLAEAAVRYGVPYIFKKTDSALRGNIGAELSAVLSAGKEKVLTFIPAFPRMNRLTVGGRQLINGVPVNESVFGADPFEPVRTADIAELICSQSNFPVKTMKSGEYLTQAKEKTIAVYDCSSDEEMRQIAEKLKDGDAFQLIAGCAGLAEIIPEILNWNCTEQELPKLPEQFLVICGSVNPITVKQLEYADKNGFVRIQLTPEQKLEKNYFESSEGKRFLDQIEQVCMEKRKVIIDTNDPTVSEMTAEYIKRYGLKLDDARVRIADSLGVIARRLMAGETKRCILMTGGDTLLGCIRKLKKAQLTPIGEFETGIVLSELNTSQGSTFVFTKSGGFGDEALLVNMGKEICGNETGGIRMSYQIKLPSCVYGGEGSIEKIKEIIAREGADRIVVFSDKGIEATGLLKLLTSELDQLEVQYHIFTDCKPEPTYLQVEEVVNLVQGYACDLIIGIGGGSVMDAAKLASVLKDAPYTIRDLMNDPSLAKKKVKTVMIPSTCGTGSEATCNAIVAVPEEQSKKGIVNEEMIPDYVILDSRMIAKLPKPIVAATGVDALAHVVECYTSKKATPFSNPYALEGAKLIFDNIREAYNNPDNMEAKNNMMLGAYYGGIAITGSGTTAVHALSYPLGGKFHIAHGVSNAILFAHVMAFNKDGCEPQLAQICDAINPQLAKESESVRAQYVIDQIAEIVRDTNIPTDLNQYGVSMENLDFLVTAGSQQQRLLVNNCKELSLEDIREIYLKVLK